MVLGNGRGSGALLDGGNPGCMQVLTGHVGGIHDEETRRRVCDGYELSGRGAEKMDWPPDNSSNAVGLCRTLWIWTSVSWNRRVERKKEAAEGKDGSRFWVRT
jgi:hypothetical protein